MQPGELDDRDRRYEPHVEPVPPGTRRAAEVVPWRDWQVHVERVGDPHAGVRMMLVHGAGGNAAAMWPFAAHLSALGADVVVPDLPGYGRTAAAAARPGALTYQDWQSLLADLATRYADDRPLVLVGASMGGMLALDAAALSGRGDLVVTTCLLDLTDPEVLRGVTRWPALARATRPAMGLARRPLAGVRVPMRTVAPVHAIANDPGLVAEVLADARGGGGAMPLGWFRSLVTAGPAVPPESYAGPPVLVVHPSADRWTPPRLTARFLHRLAGEHDLVALPGCGHFPVEQPGFQVLLDTVQERLARLGRAGP